MENGVILRKEQLIRLSLRILDIAALLMFDKAFINHYY
ncbi:hypothetical protein NBRC111894_72 [Sporolactobacillus inulinus]|uniref:Uncharacterized protein n=1 Tax=Sporolactobacillus inulinus TaxID=2078 RepID=A0A4Y1Z6F6_9BACL|nr:hypothetical protein NBRC111894_72 [Sporolactobacillus inulinus]